MVANQGNGEILAPARIQQKPVAGNLGSRCNNGNGNCAEAGSVLNLSTINPHILGFQKMEYAARGPIITRAMTLEQELKGQVSYKYKLILRFFQKTCLGSTFPSRFVEGITA